MTLWKKGYLTRYGYMGMIEGQYRLFATEKEYENYAKEKEMYLLDETVSHPNHYQTKSGMEAIQVIEAFTEDLTGFEAVCTANILKYACRWKKKNGIQDVKKIIQYAEFLLEYLEKQEPNA